MIARIKPLDGKYYGTEIEYDGWRIIKVWHGDGDPSQRQLDYWGVSLEEAKNDDYMCDSHYETMSSLRIAEAITQALRSL